VVTNPENTAKQACKTVGYGRIYSYMVPFLGTKDLKYPQAVPCLAPAALYGEVSAEVVNMLRFTGTPTTHFDSKFGYVRDLTP